MEAREEKDPELMNSDEFSKISKEAFTEIARKMGHDDQLITGLWDMFQRGLSEGMKFTLPCILLELPTITFRPIYEFRDGHIIDD